MPALSKKCADARPAMPPPMTPTRSPDDDRPVRTEWRRGAGGESRVALRSNGSGIVDPLVRPFTPELDGRAGPGEERDYRMDDLVRPHLDDDSNPLDGPFAGIGDVDPAVPHPDLELLSGTPPVRHLLKARTPDVRTAHTAA